MNDLRLRSIFCLGLVSTVINRSRSYSIGRAAFSGAQRRTIGLPQQGKKNKLVLNCLDASHKLRHVSFKKNTMTCLCLASQSQFSALPPQPQEDESLASNKCSYRGPNKLHERRRRDWINRSVKYYSTVRRMNTELNFNKEDDISLNSSGQTAAAALSAAALSAAALSTAAKLQEQENRKEFVELATRHYCALRKIKSGELYHAERIYRRVIDKSINDRKEGHCDHAVLAASTLLLALLKQRMGDIKGTRAVFVNFFRIVGEDDLRTCKCSAKVLQAFALFEMKRGHSIKSLFLVNKAVSMDKNLAPVLEWKQFREVMSKVHRSADHQQLRP